MPKIAEAVTVRRGVMALLVLLLGLGASQAQSPLIEDAKAKAVARLTAAERAKGEVQELQQHADYTQAASRDANLTSTWQRAEQLLETAQNALRNADTTPSANAYRDAGILANGSRRAFQDVASRIQRKLKDIAKEREPPKTAAPTTAPEAQQTSQPSDAAAASPGGDRGTDGGAPSPSGTRRSVAQRSATSPASTSPASTSPASTSPASTSQSDVAPRGPKLTAAAPPLRQAIDAFFRGDDLAVLEALKDSRSLGTGRQQAHALMLRSAAQYHLYLLGGEKDYAQRSAAVEDAIASHRLSPELEPSRDLFSPRFVDFFINTH